MIDEFDDFPMPPQLGWLDEQPLLLASASQTRMAMLMDAGLPIVVAPSDVDEAPVKAEGKANNTSAAEVAEQLAVAKASSVSQMHPGQITVGADQMLVLRDSKETEQWFDKPENRGLAHKNLSILSGKSHQLVTATAVCVDGEVQWSSSRSADLTMRDLSDAYIRTYLDILGDEVLWSVGGYQLEGLGAQLFEAVAGDFFTILGMDLTGLLAHLRDRQALLA